MKNYLQPGVTVTFTAAADAVSDQLVALGDNGLHGICAYDVETGEEGEAQVEGVFTYAKLETDEPSAFDIAYFDAGNDRLTTTASTHVPVGVFMKDYANPSTEAEVLLMPQLQLSGVLTVALIAAIP